MNARPLSGRRILLVEDEFFQALETARRLEDAGAQVIGPAADPASVRDQMDPQCFDAAILDINLGQGADFTIAEALSRRAVPIMFLTGYDCARLPDALTEVPCLLKPANFDEVIRTVGRLLDS